MQPLATLPALSVLALAAALGPLSAQERVPLVNVDQKTSLDAFRLTSCTTTRGEADGNPCLDLAYRADTDWPSFRLDQGRAYDLLDWSACQVLVVRVSNTSEAPLKLGIRVDDDSRANGAQYCRQGSIDLAPGLTADVQFDLGLLKLDGMRGQPRGRGLDRSQGLWVADNGRPIRTQHIVSFQLFLPKPQRDDTVRFFGAWLERRGAPATVKPFVDRFGQFTDEDWPGKLYRDEEFGVRLADEEADLKAHLPPADRNRYGGWVRGPRLEATGRFRVLKHEGRWWFADPDGWLFWSMGITGVRAESGGPILGREAVFSWLPAADDPLRQFYRPEGRGMIDFYRMNLYRKYGQTFAERFADLAVRRLPSWGFNTVANWSDETVWRRAAVPYTIPVHATVPAVRIWAERAFPDVFGPEFEPAYRQRLRSLAPFRDDPWLLGVFIDNELPWAGGSPRQAYLLPETILRTDTPARLRQVLLEDLRAIHGTIEALNAAWGTAIPTWDAPAAAFALDDAQHERARNDLAALVTHIARQYFGTCRRLMNEEMPGCLYFGPRFASHNRECVTVARELCDAVCFNIYSDLPTDGTRTQYAAEMDFPLLIGEYHFGALDRGMFHTGLRGAANQDERAAKFARYLRTAITQPWCVGAHWFQMRDQPLTGRGDGENYNIGFVTITDTPYPEMRAQARAVGAELYALRAAPRP